MTAPTKQIPEEKLILVIEELIKSIDQLNKKLTCIS
jgi:hypothetical protein